MACYSWDPALDLGIGVVDDHHRRFVDFLNDLDAARRENDQEAVTRILDRLIDHAAMHFAFEESLMKQVGYPLAEAHRKVHDAFFGSTLSQIRLHESGSDVTRKVMSNLYIWLDDHIRKEDRDYARYFAQSESKSWIGRAWSRFRASREPIT